MALFSQKAKQSEVSAASQAKATDRNLEAVIIRPVITEKSVGQSDKRVYAFFVEKNANKHSVAAAVKAVYKVTPVKVNIVNKAPKKVMSRARGRMVSQSGYKKAYVYLKDGDSINII